MRRVQTALQSPTALCLAWLVIYYLYALLPIPTVAGSPGCVFARGTRVFDRTARRTCLHFNILFHRFLSIYIVLKSWSKNSAASDSQKFARGRGFLNLKNSAAAFQTLNIRPGLSSSQKFGRGRLGVEIPRCLAAAHLFNINATGHVAW